MVAPIQRTPPDSHNRSDALDLLDQLLDAENVRGMDFALTALRDAVEREVI
jgi:hypothetical protein